MTVFLPVRNSHCTGVKFTVTVSCSDEFAVPSCPLLCLQRWVTKVASGLFYCWSLLHKYNLARNLQRFTLSYGSRRFVAWDCWTQGLREGGTSCEGGGLRPKIRSGVGDCAETVSTTASASAPSQEGIASWTPTMLPLWQFRPYRNFVQVQRCQVQLLQLTGHLEAACRKKACSKAQGVRWIDVLEMVKAAPCRNSEVQKLHPGTGHCRRRKFHFYLRLDWVGQAETSTGSVALPFGK